MIRHIAARATLAALVTVLPLTGFAATPTASVPAAASLKVKGGVKLTLKNNSGVARAVKIGDTTVTMQPNEQLSIQVPVNTVITAVGDAGNHKDGDKLITVTKDISGTTMSFS